MTDVSKGNGDGDGDGEWGWGEVYEQRLGKGGGYRMRGKKNKIETTKTVRLP